MGQFKLAFDGAGYGDMSPDAVIANVLKKDAATRQQVCIELVQNHRGTGAPSVIDFNIVRVDFLDQELGKGTVTLEYLVDVTFGCEDVTNQFRSKDVITFHVDLENSQIVFAIPDYPVRDTHEEF